jgi:flagellar basal-body rod protein FlgG
MIRGLYTAVSQLDVQLRRQELLAHNLANLGTPGFKQTLLAQAGRTVLGLWRLGGPALTAPVGPLGTGTELEPAAIDLSPGPITDTGEPLDLAVDGVGFFVVERPDGPAYTRDGTFFVDAEGFLTTAAGDRVLGLNGPIHVGTSDFRVDPDGTVTVGGQAVDRLRLADLSGAPGIVRVGDNLLRPADPNFQPPPAPPETAVIQGAIEQSNVNVTETVAQLLAAMRAYQSAQRMLLEADSTLDRAVQQLGRWD